jgi:hypothetical protein
MATADTQPSDDGTDEEQQENTAWASVTPDARFTGTPKELIYAGELSDTAAQPDDSYGVVLEDVEIIDAALWVNDEKPDDGTMADFVSDETPTPTDYRITDALDPIPNTNEVGGETFLMTGEEGPSNYVMADEQSIDGDVIVWFNGLTGQRLARTLDFNGRPFARWVRNDDGSHYLIKGLYQSAEGWRDARGKERGQMADEGLAPRTARAPLLRWSVANEYADGNIVSASLRDEPQSPTVLFDMQQQGRGYRLYLADADVFEAEYGSLDADLPMDGDYVDSSAEGMLDMPYHPQADEVLEEAGFSMHMYTGEGWQDEPSGWTPQSTSEVSSFGIAADGDDGDAADEEGFTAKQRQFITEIADALAGSGMTPDEMFDGGVAGLVQKHNAQFDSVPDAGEVEAELYARVAHLDPSELDE